MMNERIAEAVHIGGETDDELFIADEKCDDELNPLN